MLDILGQCRELFGMALQLALQRPDGWGAVVGSMPDTCTLPSALRC